MKRFLALFAALSLISAPALGQESTGFPAIPKGSQMANAQVAVLATLEIKPEAAARFEVAMRELREKVLANEAGCLRYDIARGPQPNMYRVFELYQSAEAFSQHMQQPYVVEATALLGTSFVVPPTLEIHDVIN